MRTKSVMKPRRKQYLCIFVFSALCVFIFGFNREMFLSNLTAYFKKQFHFGTPIVQQMYKQGALYFDLETFLEAYRSTSNTVDNMIQKRIKFLSRNDNKIGVYLNPNKVGEDGFLDSTFDSLDESGGSAIVFDVKGDYVYFQSTSPLAEEFGLINPLYELPEIVAKAKERGIYTIARLVAAKDPILSLNNPDVRIRHPKTNIAVGYEWVDLSNPTILEYNKQVMRDLIAAGVDEINIDYLRYPTEYKQSLIGLTWEEKAERLEKFIRMARSLIDEQDPSVKLGISTYAILGWNFEVNVKPLGQDVVRFAPYVDVISPMAYPSTFKRGAYYDPNKHPRSRMYYLVYQTLKGYEELLGEEYAWKLRPWIQGYYVTQNDMRDEIDAVFDAGYCGFTIWSAGNFYSVPYKVLPELEIPDRCMGLI